MRISAQSIRRDKWRTVHRFDHMLRVRTASRKIRHGQLCRIVKGAEKKISDNSGAFRRRTAIAESHFSARLRRDRNLWCLIRTPQCRWSGVTWSEGVRARRSIALRMAVRRPDSTGSASCSSPFLLRLTYRHRLCRCAFRRPRHLEIDMRPRATCFTSTPRIEVVGGENRPAQSRTWHQSGLMAGRLEQSFLLASTVKCTADRALAGFRFEASHVGSSSRRHCFWKRLDSEQLPQGAPDVHIDGCVIANCRQPFKVGPFGPGGPQWS